MNCPSCSTTIPDTAKFCPECGEKIVRKTVCPDCGTEAAPGSKFCAECGHKFPVASAVAQPAKAAAAKSTDTAKTTKKAKAAKPAITPETEATITRVFQLFLANEVKTATADDARQIENAAKAGNPRAMFLWAELLSCPEGECDSGVTRDIPASVSWYRKAAEAGDGWGMVGLGMACADTASEEGAEDGLEPDFDEANSWFDKAKGLVEEDVRLASKMMCVFNRATYGLNEDESPDFSDAIEQGRTLLRLTEGTAPEALFPLTRVAAGIACLLIATWEAGTEEEVRGLLARGSAMGNEDCANALAGMEGGGDENGEQAGYLVEKDGILVKKGTPSSLVFVSGGCASKDACRHLDFTVSVANTSNEDTGSLSLRLWFCDKPFEGGQLNGYRMCETDFPYLSLRRRSHFENLELPCVRRLADPPTGDYHIVMTVGECNEDGNQYIVGWLNFKETSHWNHEGSSVVNYDVLEPGQEGVLDNIQAESLMGFLSLARKNFQPSAFQIGRYVAQETVQSFSSAAQERIDDATLRQKFANPGIPIAFIDGNPTDSGKCGLLVTRNGLFALNGTDASSRCPSGCVDWNDFAGESGCVAIVGKDGILLCRSPAVGVNLPINTALRDSIRDCLAESRRILRDELDDAPIPG